MRFRYGLMAYRAAITSAFDALDAVVAAQLEETSPSPDMTNGYSTTMDTSTTAPTGRATPATAATTPATSTVLPSQRALNRAFDELDSDDFTTEGYPRRTELLIILAEHDEPPVDKETAELAYDHYVHERAARGATYSSPKRSSKQSASSTKEHEGKKPTQAAIREAVEALDDEDFTDRGQPRTAAVNERLARHGYARVTADMIHEATEGRETLTRRESRESHERTSDREEEPGRKPTQRAIREAVEALRESDWTEAGHPRTAALNEQLERMGYERVSASQIREATERTE